MTPIELYAALVSKRINGRFFMSGGRGKSALIGKMLARLKVLEINPSDYLAQMFGWYTENRCIRLLKLKYPTPELLQGWHCIALYTDIKAGRIEGKKIKLPSVVVVKPRAVRTDDVQTGEIDPLSALVCASDLSGLDGLKRAETVAMTTKLKRSKTLWANKETVIRASLHRKE